MARINYYYDTETCKYERVKTSTSDIILNAAGFVLLSFVFAVGLVFAYTRYFESPKETALARENEELILYYELLNKELDMARDMLTSLQERDDNIYRVIFEAEPIPANIRSKNMFNSNYKNILAKSSGTEKLIVNTIQKMENLKRQMYIQTKSHDELAEMVKNKQDMLASIPAIQPVINKELNKLVSGFGMRFHPIYKVKKMHTGVDFMAPKGTPIYATGDGKVRLVQTSLGGYGKQVEVDHGYGYVTKYAHMSAFNVKQGQKVKRGECIGYVGNTGSSTAPHLHYEVIHNGKKVNPVHYFYNDLNPEEYEKILEIASKENQSLS
ncbi:M23 family metallopeptidase [Cytophagaceae bacterium ABcell3]|nr:M23 family metallopeptidase [Cytophagaceae bacterium ABcell3]